MQTLKTINYYYFQVVYILDAMCNISANKYNRDQCVSQMDVSKKMHLQDVHIEYIINLNVLLHFINYLSFYSRISASQEHHQL